jgi:hypothetical protein
MDPDRWQRIKELFDSTVDLPPAERELHLNRMGSDPTLISEVRRLRQAHDEEPEFLQPVAEPAVSLRAGDLAGGKYKIVQLPGPRGHGRGEQVAPP